MRNQPQVYKCCCYSSQCKYSRAAPVLQLHQVFSTGSWVAKCWNPASLNDCRVCKCVCLCTCVWCISMLACASACVPHLFMCVHACVSCHMYGMSVEATLAAMPFDLVVLSRNQLGVWGCGGWDEDDVITWPGKPVGTALSRKHSLHLSASISCRNIGAHSLVASHLTKHPRRTSMISWLQRQFCFRTRSYNPWLNICFCWWF